MAFLVKADLDPYILQDDLSAISQGDDDNISDAISYAEAEAKNYLRVKYDIDTIFAQTGTDRDKTVLNKVIDLAIFELYKALPSNMVPEKRLFFYQEAKDWFEKAAKGGLIELSLPHKLDDDGNEENPRFVYGSNTKISRHGY